MAHETRILNANDPYETAQTLVRDSFTEGGTRTVHALGDELVKWTGSHYVAFSRHDVRAHLYDYLDKSEKLCADGAHPFRPNMRAVSEILDAFRAAVNLSDSPRSPVWLDNRREPPPHELLVCRNGLLHIPTRRLLKHDPALLTRNALPYDYHPEAPPPGAWLAFLESLWPDDPEAVAALQEVFGCLVSGSTSHQKIFMLIGPKRAGKGTIGRVARELLGKENVAGPTLSSLAGNFGLQPLINRTLAMIADARLSGRADQTVIIERLLAISGEDTLTVDRKNRTAWTGQLPARFLIMTNELPRLADASGALASRFLMLTMSQSFYGREDLELFSSLKAELPGILGWALDGWDRLQARGHFVQPQSSREKIQDLEDLGSPVSAFLRSCCQLQAGTQTPVDALYAKWCEWCRSQGHRDVSTAQVFGRDLRTVLPGVQTTERRAGKKRWRAYVGIGLRSADTR